MSCVSTVSELDCCDSRLYELKSMTNITVGKVGYETMHKNWIIAINRNFCAELSVELAHNAIHV